MKRMTKIKLKSKTRAVVNRRSRSVAKSALCEAGYSKKLETKPCRR